MRTHVLALLLAAGSSLSGCTLANLTPTARFQESANVLNDASRWGAVGMALQQVSPKYKDRFLSRHRDWGGGLSIADAELMNMQVADDRKTALSEVTFSWYRQDGVTVHTSVVSQKWEADHG